MSTRRTSEEYAAERAHVDAAVLDFMRSFRSPVTCASNLTHRLYGKGTKSREYGVIKRSLARLEEQGLVGSVNWPGANNVTVVWLTERLK